MPPRSSFVLAVVAAAIAATACTSADGTDSAPIISAAAAVVAPVSALAQQTTTTTPPSTTSVETTTTATTTTTTVPETTTTVAETTTVAATTTLPEVPVLDPPLSAIGTADGEETRRVQQRLLDLGFWLSGVDGDYGTTTTQAVMAFQKWSGLDRTGKLDPITTEFLNATTERVRGRATEGTLVEVDKDRQLAMLVKDGITVWSLNISSGNGQYYLEENQKKPGTWESGRSVTPSGTFVVNRERPEGWWEGDLGKIYRPKYFNGGIAVHGSGSIPGQPASHGCVRVSVPAMDMIWESGLVPKGTTVVVYGSDIEPRGPKPTAPPAPPPTPAPDTTVAPGDTTATPADTTAVPPPETTVAAPSPAATAAPATTVVETGPPPAPSPSPSSPPG